MKSIIFLTVTVSFILSLLFLGSADAFMPSGEVSSSIITNLPDRKPTCCEHPWTIRFLHYEPESISPRRMYFASSHIETDKPVFYVSFSLGKKAKAPKISKSSGAIMKAVFDPQTSKLKQVGGIAHFPECVFMEGIAVSRDGKKLAAICRRNYKDRDYDFDALSTHPSKKWMTQPKCADHAMWLYEWDNKDFHSRPKKILLHKAVGYGWEYGNNYLRMGENDNTYGIAIKSRVVDPKGQCHEADAFLVMKQKSKKMVSHRGFSWACGTGHTLFNRPAYNPYTRRYTLMCSTDASPKRNSDKFTSFWIRTEHGPAIEFGQTNGVGIRSKGGTGTLLPLKDGGFLGVLVGVRGNVYPADKVPVRPPSSIGLVRFNSKGKVRGKIRWIKSNKNSYLSFPQITFLGTDISGKDRYLLGYAIMKRLNKSYDNDDDSYRYPWAYYVQEIDVNGNTLTKSTKLKQSGWGEQDELVSLGMGRVAWAYIPKPTLKKDSNGSTLPSCNSYSLKLSVYKSSASYQKPKALPKSDKIYSAYQGNDNSFMTDEICKDSVLVGIKWQGRHLLDRVAGICSNKKETKFIGGQEIDKEYPMRRYVCSGKDNRVKKISVWAFGLNNAFDRIQITCSNGKSSGIVGGWGREGKRQNPPLQCPDGTYPIGISGKKGQSVDVLALVCKKGKAPKISHGVSDESSRDKVLLSSYQGDNKYDNQKALCKDSKLIGLRLHSGLIVDKIIGICSNNTSTSYLGSKSPGPKRASYTCPGQGNRIDSLSVWAFGFQKSIERIQITCKNGQRSEILGGWGNDGKLQKPPLRCPPKSYPIGISGNKGQWLKALALACRK